MGERLVRAARSWPDPVEAHESLVTAAMAFCWAGKFDRAATVAREAKARAAQLSGHRMLHSAAAETLRLVPTGRFAELGRATSRVLELAREEGHHTCGTATMALAGRVLWLFETRQPDDAASALELLERLRSPHRVPLYDYITGQILRPVVGVKGMTAMLEQFQAPRHDGEAIMLLRLRLPILALAGAHEELDTAIANARLLAKSGCAPAIESIADWAAAAQTATDNPAEALARALAAATALTQHGEPYTAARLLADFLAVADGSDVHTVAQETAAQLHAMGALGSAAELHARAQSQSARQAPRSTAIASQTPRLKSRS